MCLCACLLAHERKESAFIAKVNSRCSGWFPAAILVYLQYGASIQSSIKLLETSGQITQKRCTTQTWDLEKFFMYWVFIPFHFLGFFHWTLSIFCFGVTVKTIYRVDMTPTPLVASWLASTLLCSPNLRWRLQILKEKFAFGRPKYACTASYNWESRISLIYCTLF